MTKSIHSMALVIGILIFAIGCQDQSAHQQELEQFTYQMYDDVEVLVTLDPEMEQPEMSFESVEAHNEFLLGLEEETQTLSINKKIWDDLGHYFDPYFLSTLSSDYTITLGNDLYKATPEEMLIKKAGETEFSQGYYYGLDGKQDLRESAMIYEHLGTGTIAQIDPSLFKNEDNKQKLIQFQLAEIKGAQTEVMSKRSGRYFNTNFSHVTYMDFPGGLVTTAPISFWLWNESYTKTFGGRRSKGGTVVHINRGWGWQEINGKIAPYLGNGQPDNTTGWTQVLVKGGKKGGGYYQGTGSSNTYKVSKDGVGRDKNNGTTSNHWAKIRDNNTGLLVLALNDIPQSAANN